MSLAVFGLISGDGDLSVASGVVGSPIPEPTQDVPHPVPPFSPSTNLFDQLEVAPSGATAVLYSNSHPSNEMYPVTNFPIVDVSVTDPNPSTAQFPSAKPVSKTPAPAQPAAAYKKTDAWPSDPKKDNWLDVLLGVAKVAPAGIKTYYDIQVQNQALKTMGAKNPQAPAATGAQKKSSSLTPWIIGGVALLVIGAGAVALSRRSK